MTMLRKQKKVEDQYQSRHATRYSSAYDENMDPFSKQHSNCKPNRATPPKQSDNSGTMFRIRPRTPKLNLLQKKVNR